MDSGWGGWVAVGRGSKRYMGRSWGGGNDCKQAGRKRGMSGVESPCALYFDRRKG